MLFRSDRKSTRLNSSHTLISYAVFCLKKKKNKSNPGRSRATLARRREGGGRPVLRFTVWTPPRLPAKFARLKAVAPFLVFFLNDPAPPGVSLFPLPAPLPA